MFAKTLLPGIPLLLLGTGLTFGQVDISTKTGPFIEGCRVLPSDNIWNVPVDDLPRDQASDAYVSVIGRDKNLHPDFGAGLWPPITGAPMGIPFVTVPGSQTQVPISFRYPDESDPGPYPVPPDAPIEGGESSEGDRHVIVLDRDNCVLYELYKANREDNGVRWNADSGAIFDLKSNTLRPQGWTSADAAGLPILPGLVRFDEVAAGEINHAIRFTVPQTRRAYVWPARHFASQLTGSQYPPMGQRFRLKASFEISGYHPQIQVILKALKKYGMILSDNGSSWYITGAPDDRWDNELLDQLKTVKGSDFEAVDVSSLMLDPDSARTSARVQQVLFFPHLGMGTGGEMLLESEIILVNLGDDSEVTIEFFTAEGTPWIVDLEAQGTGSRFEFSLPRGRQSILTAQRNAPAEVGYARVSVGRDVQGTAILRGHDGNSGITLFEAGVPAATLHRSFSVFLDSLGANDTGLALLFPHPVDQATVTQMLPANIDLRLYDDSFQLLAEESLQLNPGEYLPKFISELFQDPAASLAAREMRGLLSIGSDQELAALTLRQRYDPAKTFPDTIPTLTVFPVMKGRPEPDQTASAILEAVPAVPNEGKAGP